MKVTLDTNVLVSALGWFGKPHEILDRAISGEFELVISYDQFDELSRVLNYDKFGFTEEEKDTFKSLLFEKATFVKPKHKITAVPDDPSDNIILECAVDGNADFIITGDPHLLDLVKYGSIFILKPRQFLSILNKI
jgi:uncharacterized protein